MEPRARSGRTTEACGGELGAHVQLGKKPDVVEAWASKRCCRSLPRWPPRSRSGNKCSTGMP
eukprot:451158-Pyramimonas_sp.AAC.1